MIRTFAIIAALASLGLSVIACGDNPGQRAGIGGVASAHVKDHSRPSDQATQIAAASTNLPPHEIAYTDRYGFHFDKDGALVDANGYPVTTDPQ